MPAPADTAEYRPASRRPIAEGFRRTARAAVDLCLRLRIHPDAISYASIVAAAAAAVCFWQSSRFFVGLLIAPLFCYLRLWFNMLDGMVAIAGGTASKRGEILNDLPDRISDVLIFTSVAHSGWCDPFLGYWAAIFALLTAYVGTFGQAVGGRREFAGIMSKPWRMVTLSIGAWVLFALIGFGSHPPTSVLRYSEEPGRAPTHPALRGTSEPASLPTFFTMDVTLSIVILGCVQTIWVRLAHIMRSLDEKNQAGN